MCYNSTNLSDGMKVVEYVHTFVKKEEGKQMYPDDSLTLHTDLYQINMMQVYFDQGIHNKKAVFEVYFRQQPFKNGYAVFAGLERIVNYLEDLRFSDSDIAYSFSH